MCTFSVINWPLITFLFWRVHAHGCIQHWLENRAIHSGAFSRQGAFKENNVKVEDTIPFLTRCEIKLGRFKHRFLSSVSVSFSLFTTPHTPPNGKTLLKFQISCIQQALSVSACAKTCAGFWEWEGEKDLTSWGSLNRWKETHLIMSTVDAMLL